MIAAATAWARAVAARVQRKREILEIGRRTAEALLVSEWLPPSEFEAFWKAANLQAPDEESIRAEAAK